MEAYLAARDWKKAEGTLTTARVTFPKDPGLLTAQGHSLLLATRLEEAADAFKKALAQDPRRLAPAIGLAEMRLTLSMLPEAETAVTQVEALSPAAGRLLRGWFLLARWDLGRGDPDAAAKLLSEVARGKEEPGRTAAMLLIELHAKRGNRKAAQAELKRQTKRHGDRPELQVAYSLALVEADANDEAISTLGRAEKASQGLNVRTTVLARLQARLSQAKWQAGDFPAARRSAEKLGPSGRAAATPWPCWVSWTTSKRSSAPHGRSCGQRSRRTLLWRCLITTWGLRSFSSESERPARMPSPVPWSCVPRVSLQMKPGEPCTDRSLRRPRRAPRGWQRTPFLLLREIVAAHDESSGAARAAPGARGAPRGEEAPRRFTRCGERGGAPLQQSGIARLPHAILATA